MLYFVCKAGIPLELISANDLISACIRENSAIMLAPVGQGEHRQIFFLFLFFAAVICLHFSIEPEFGWIEINSVIWQKLGMVKNRKENFSPCNTTIAAPLGEGKSIRLITLFM